MLRGDPQKFYDVLTTNIRLSFELVYPIIRDDEVIRRLNSAIEVICSEYFVINTNEPGKLYGKINRSEFAKIVKTEIFYLLESFTPNLRRLVNNRVAEFMKHFNKSMIPFIRQWGKANDNTRSRTKRLRAKTLPDNSLEGDRECVGSGGCHTT